MTQRDLSIDCATLQASERRTLAAEGPYRVQGRYYANPDNADRQRPWAAARAVREATRQDRWSGRVAAAMPATLPCVATWLTGREAVQVDAGAGAHARWVHCASFRALRDVVASGDADAILVSAAIVSDHDVSGLDAIRRGFPGLSVAALITDAGDDRAALAAAFRLGHAGVAALFDVRQPSGWATLRASIATRRLPDAFLRACVAGVLADLRAGAGECNVYDGLVRFFCVAFESDVRRAHDVADRLGVCVPTLNSRFFRAGLPSVKRYVATARLVRAARIGEAPGLSLSAIAGRLDASSPQSYHRSVRLFTGLSAAEFRRQFTGAAMFHRFRASLVHPFRDTLRTFDPLGTGTLPRSREARAVSFPAHGTGRAA